MSGSKGVTPKTGSNELIVADLEANQVVIEGTRVEGDGTNVLGNADQYTNKGPAAGALSNEPALPGATSLTGLRAKASDILPNNIPGKPADYYVTCPMIGCLIANGKLDLDPDGNVDLKQFFKVMTEFLGITPERAGVTVGTGVIGNHFGDLPNVVDGKLNIYHLQGSLLDHQAHGDTGIIRQNAFSQQRFDALISHRAEGTTYLTEKQYAAGIRAQLALDATSPLKGLDVASRGFSEDVFEAGAIINTIGYTDAKTGERRIDIGVLEDFYKNRRLPSQDVMMGRHPTGVLEHLATMGRIDVAVAEGELADAANAVKGAIDSGVASTQRALLSLCPHMAKMMQPKDN
jgi:hypothetical protein